VDTPPPPRKEKKIKIYSIEEMIPDGALKKEKA